MAAADKHGQQQLGDSAAECIRQTITSCPQVNPNVHGICFVRKRRFSQHRYTDK